MFLHEIFHQGLKARIANWPTLVLGGYCGSVCIHHAAYSLLFATYTVNCEMHISLSL